MKIVNDISANRFNYCHVLEIGTVYELEEIVSELVNEFQHKYTELEILEFFTTITIYYFVDEEEGQIEDPEEEEKIYNFNFENFIKELN